MWWAQGWVQLEMLMLQIKTWLYPQIDKFENVNTQKITDANDSPGRFTTQQFTYSNVVKESMFSNQNQKEMFSPKFLLWMFPKFVTDS